MIVKEHPLFDFDTPIDRQGTSSIKWDRYKGKETIPLWVADMDFLSPPSVIEALQKRVKHGVFGYTEAPDELNETVINMLQEKYAWSIEKEWIIWLPGLVSGINVTCRSIGNESTTVITMPPIYPPFLTAPKLSYRNQTQVPMLQKNNRWVMDYGRFEESIDPSSRLLLLCNPQNPTGRIFTRDELVQLTDICLKHDLVICSDEIHCDLVLDKDKIHIPTATLSPEIAQKTITLLSPSKTYNVAGLNCSLAIIPNRKLRVNFRKAKEGIVPHVNALGYTAALASYRDSNDWHKELLDYLRTNCDLAERAVNNIPGLSTTHVEATYLMWIDARALKVENPARFFEETGVGFSDGADFGDPQFVRLNFGCSRRLLEEALERMRGALERK